jgi:hypothetical protein
MSGRELRPWLYFDPALQDAVDPSSWAEIGDQVAGWVGSDRAGQQLPDGSHRICIAMTEEELRTGLRGSQDIFVLCHLAESLTLLDDVLEGFGGALWLEDSYVSRYLLEKQLASDVQTRSPVSLVGTTPDRGRLLPAGRYAYMYAGQQETAALSAALQLGVVDVWLRASGPSDVRLHLQRIADVAEAADLALLFGAQPAELERTWQRRLCLAVQRELPAGHCIEEADLVCLPLSGGLSAEMRDRVIGKTLRYPVSSRTVLTFGLLES